MKKKNILAMGLVATVLATSFQSIKADETGKSSLGIESHWSKTSFERWMNHDIVQGDENGDLMPEKVMTKAEYIKVLNRFLGLEAEADLELADVKENAWYESEIKKAIAAGYLVAEEKDGRSYVNPDAPVTRLEAVELFTGALDLKREVKSSENFSDTTTLSQAEKDSIALMQDIGAINGYPDGSFRPEQILKRSELVSLLDKGVKVYVDEPGQFDSTVKGLVIINSEKVKLDGAQIFGDVVVTDKAVEGLEIKDTKVFGSVYIDNQGAKEEIKLSGKNLISKVVAKGDLEVELSKDTTITEVAILEDESDIKIEGQGQVKKIMVKADDVKVNNKKASKDVELKLEGNKGVTKVDDGVDTVSSATKYSGGGSSGGGSSSGGSSSGGGSQNDSYNFIVANQTKIMEIEHALYYVIALENGDVDDFEFHLDGVKITPTKVNTEGTIVKYELSDVGSYTLKITKGSTSETITRSKGL